MAETIGYLKGAYSFFNPKDFRRDIVAAPVGHIFCALALLNSPSMQIVDKDAFLVGTSFPDIRYLGGISRTTTHFKGLEGKKLGSGGETSFEAGRRFHVLIDKKREIFMRKNDAYRFIDEGPLKTQMLKLVEDRILFERLSEKFKPAVIFHRSYEEEYAYGVSAQSIEKWHDILSNYLDQNYQLHIWRYFTTLLMIKDSIKISKDMFSDFFKGVKNVGFLIYAYFKVEELSKDEELRKIILGFYDDELKNIINYVK